MINILKYKKVYSTYDYIMLMLTIGIVAFSDIDEICLTGQFLAIIYTSYIFLKKQMLDVVSFRLIAWIIVLATYMLTSSLWAASINRTIISTTISFIQFGAIMCCVIEYCRKGDRINKFISALTLSAVVLLIRFFLSVPIGSWGTIRASLSNSIFLDNITAVSLSYIAIIVLYKLMNDTYAKNKKIIMFILMMMIMFIVVLMGTKKGLIVFVIGLISFYLQKSKSILHSTFRIFIISVLLAFIYYLLMNTPLLYEAIGNRIEYMLGGMNGHVTDKSTETRILFMQSAFNEFLLNPVLGIGQDGFRYVNPYQFTYSHNNYTEILCNLGTIGFFIYNYMYAYLLKISIKVSRINIQPLVWLIVMLLLDVSFVSYESEFKALVLGLTIGMSNFIISNEIRRN